MIGIYKITSPINKVYIGQSIDIEKRFKYYYRLACKSQPRLYKSFITYEVKNHKFEVIEECLVELLNERERYYQDYYNSVFNGLNSRLTASDDRSGEFSLEHKEKLRLAKLGKKTGRKIIHSEETRKKIGLANKGRIKSKEEIEKHRKSTTGLKRTAEQKKHFSKVKTGVLNPMYGKKVKESSKELQRIKLSGELNYLSKIILNTETGIFYFGLNEASKSINIKKGTLHVNITINKINNTPFIYV